MEFVHDEQVGDRKVADLDARHTDAADPAGELPSGWSRRRTITVLSTALIVLALFLTSTGIASALFSPGAAPTDGSGQRHRPMGNAAQGASHPSVHLAPATSMPAPAPPTLAGAAPMRPHEVFGYAPYWTLPRATDFDLKDLTTLAYFSVGVAADGGLVKSGPGWNGYQSQDLVDLVGRAHAAGDRVVLAVTCFDQRTLDRLTSDPGAPARLSAALIAAVQAKSLDGVNIDFEGAGAGDRNGLTALVSQVSASLHATNPHWQVSMAVYGSAAADSGGFCDVTALVPAVDAFFVMAYDMNDKVRPSATSPLVGPAYTDVKVLQQFLAVVPAQKIILGLPYYGYDWPTTDGTLTATATGRESPVTYAAIVTAGHPVYWDPTTQTPWTAYKVGDQWHETFFDDPTSMALKAQLADFAGIAGVGIWALGMDGNDPAMLGALLGHAPAVKDPPTGPPPPPGSGFLSSATYAGTGGILLTPIVPPTGGTAVRVGLLDGFATNDPALSCLQSGPALEVWSYSNLPGVLVTQAATPGDCASAMWTFTPPATPPTSSMVPPISETTTSLPHATTTTTTRPPPTTTSTTPTNPSTTTSTDPTTTTTGP